MDDQQTRAAPPPRFSLTLPTKTSYILVLLLVYYAHTILAEGEEPFTQPDTQLMVVYSDGWVKGRVICSILQ